jgi:outer membrane protein assembly factor BamE (lipoprotein component of BamABCDE complex)
MKRLKTFSAAACLTLFCIGLIGCDGNALSGSKLTSANYDQVRIGMSKGQVETILGSPTSIQTQDLIVYKKTTYRYENDKKFALITFKNDEVDGKDTNLDREP